MTASELYPGRKLSAVFLDLWEASKHPKPRGNDEPPPVAAAYWEEVRSGIGRQAFVPAIAEESAVPGFETSPTGHEFHAPEMIRTLVKDAFVELPGICDEPCPWEEVADGLYENELTGQIFEWTPGSAGGVLTSPIGEAF